MVFDFFINPNLIELKDRPASFRNNTSHARYQSKICCHCCLLKAS